MSSFTGTVVSVALSTKAEKKDGGFYDAWELVYRDSENRVKQLQKPITSLKYTKGLKEALMGLQPGDVFTCTSEKNDRGYLEVQSIVKGEFAVASTDGQAAPKTGRVTGSTYETPAERALRQRLIVRQSSLSAAINYMEAANKKASSTEVMDLADEFDKWVWKNENAAGTSSEPV